MIKNILIIEDDEELLLMLRSSFKMCGYNVEIAKEIDKAKEILEKKEIDLIISDIFINEENILSELKKIKKDKPRINIILTTGFDEVEKEMKSSNFPYFLKPYTMEELLSAIKSFPDY